MSHYRKGEGEEMINELKEKTKRENIFFRDLDDILLPH